MQETIVSEIWNELKRYINTVDRDDAAETVVSILIDHDSSAEDIRDAFKGDSDIKRALGNYIDSDRIDSDDEEEEFEEDDDNYNEEDDY
jgi:hypothetical protein